MVKYVPIEKKFLILEPQAVHSTNLGNLEIEKTETIFGFSYRVKILNTFS